MWLPAQVCDGDVTSCVPKGSTNPVTIPNPVYTCHNARDNINTSLRSKLSEP
jgi:hypothetical protein